LASVVLLGLSVTKLEHLASRVDVVDLQWAGSATAAKMLVLQQAGPYRTAIRWDFALIAAYTVALVFAGHLGRHVFWTRRMKGAARVAIVAAIAAAACNLAQDWILLHLLRDQPMRGVWPFRVVEALSFVKFVTLVVAAGIGIIALGTTLGRLLWHKKATRRWSAAKEAADKNPDFGEQDPLVIAPPRVEGGRQQVDKKLMVEEGWWDTVPPGEPTAAACWKQNAHLPGPPKRETTGVCLSGGGIRSASVALGALQALREPRSALDGSGLTELAQTEFIVSVSGGGYTAGAYQLALRGPDGSGRAANVAKVFAPGSAEEDHVRRHSSYIADTLGQWLAALGVLLRCVTIGVILIGLVVTTAGVAIGRFYGRIPIIAGTKDGLADLRPRFLMQATAAKNHIAAANMPHGQMPGSQPPKFPPIPPGVTLGLLVVLGLAILAYLVQIAVVPTASRGEGTLRGKAARLVRDGGATSGRYLLGLTGLLAAIGIAIPALLWLSSWLSWHVGSSPRPVATTGGLTVVIGYIGALAGTLWRKRTTVTKTGSSVVSFFTKSPGGQVLPSSMTQMLLLWLCLALLLLGVVLASCLVVTGGLANSPWAWLPLGILVVTAIVFDETWFSLYPFYRQRLASAFAIHRDISGPVKPLAGPTPLGTWGRPVLFFPEVRFAASANITTQDRTPPGRRAVPYIFTAKYVGGPHVGWVRTDYLTGLIHPAVARDLDVEAAMAISGAAFAAAMGRQTRFFEVFLALTNVRLGAWLPNPAFVAIKTEHCDDWTVPGLPMRRRLSHLVREIFGIHPSQARMLLCTDGGHYDNLGLVELLRLRCSRIYCFDASGGGVPLADTLAGAIALAREELGVEITLDPEQAYELVPGGMTPPPFEASPLASLSARMSKTAVITGDVRYPDDPPGTLPAKLIYAQAALTEDLPYEVLEYSQDDIGFPRDGTADQWFNSDQFDGYQQLGRYLGERALAAAKAIQDPRPVASPSMRTF
jgi:hypothetical protein